MAKISMQTAQEIVDTVKDVSGYNINFIDKNGIIIASTDVSRIGTFHEIGHQVAISQKTIEVEDDTSFFGTKKGINIPIKYNGMVEAVIGISGDINEVRKYAYLAQKITSILLKERELDRMGVQKKNRMNYIIHSLIYNEPIENSYVADSLEKYGFENDTICRCVVIQLNAKYNPSNLYMIQDEIVNSIEAVGTKLYTYNYPNEYVVIVKDNQLDRAWHIVTKLAKNFKKIINIGVGNKVAFSDISQSYKCAVIAVKSCVNKDTVVYDELDYELICGNISDSVKKNYLSKTVNKLNDVQINILKVYFEEDMSLQKTADRLFMHKNSLQYKLNTIANISGYNPRKFKDAVVLYTAVKLQEL